VVDPRPDLSGAGVDRYVRVTADDVAGADLASGVAWLHGAVAIEEVAGEGTTSELRIGAGPEGAPALAAVLCASGFDAAVVDAEHSVSDVFAAEGELLDVQRVGHRLVLVPMVGGTSADALPAAGFAEGGPADDVVVQLDSAWAFGSGTHPTTRSCLERVEALVAPGDRVLDVGTGTGVLAIAAARLGASAVVAIDIDPAAVAVAAANVAANDVGDVVTVTGDPLDAVEGTFDVVVANVLAGVVVELAEHLVARLVARGVLVVSGILAEREPFVVEALAAVGLRTTHRIEADGWVTLDLRG
jgi:ribosomal protein L11 methylase PrmA